MNCNNCSCPHVCRPQATIGSCDGTLHRLDECGCRCHAAAREFFEATVVTANPPKDRGQSGTDMRDWLEAYLTLLSATASKKT